MSETVSVSVRSDFYAEFILRTRRSVDVAGWINKIVSEYLDRTRDDPKVWSSPTHPMNDGDAAEEEFRLKYGDRQRGYQWDAVFLPNGTQIRMIYKKTPHYAEVQHERIVYNGQSLSPSELARKIANNTSRNAWHDLWLKPPASPTWVIANSLRPRLAQRTDESAEDLGL
jgi:hypothetical protein